MKKVLSGYLIFFISVCCQAQDSLLIRAALISIQRDQVRSDNYFVPGIFPSYITDAPKYGQKQKDNNVFYNALIGYTLNTLRSDVPQAEQEIIDDILSKNHKVFPRFKNAKGRTTYNFERTDTTFTYPYSNWIHKLRGNLEFPDDLDCTALVLMADRVPDSTASRVHDLMQEYVNKGKTKTTYRSYRKIPAYSSWFGKKFPVVFDVAVLCNVLCFVQENDLKWTKADSASLDLIIKTIKQKDHIRNPRFVSPYYPKHSLILYHLARLMNVKSIAALEEMKPQLAEEAKAIIAKSNNTLEKIMLNSALMKWGYKPFDLTFSDEILQDLVGISNLSFFAGNIPSYLKQPWKGFLIKTKAMQYYHYCGAFNKVLVLEYLMLKKKAKDRN